jgi:hypothetical protein
MLGNVARLDCSGEIRIIPRPRNIDQYIVPTAGSDSPSDPAFSSVWLMDQEEHYGDQSERTENKGMDHPRWQGDYHPLFFCHRL